MKIADIIKKVLAKKELTDEENNFFESYEEPTGGIPKSRLDAEIAKRKEADDKLNDLQGQFDDIKTKLEEKDEKDLSEIDKLKKDHAKELGKLNKQVETLTGERDAATKDLSGLKFKNSVAGVANKHGFKDIEYLGYLVKQQGEDLDISDDAAVNTFMENLKKESPGQFKAEGKPGAGSGPGEQSKGSSDEFKEAQSKGDINAMLANAPEIE